MTIWATNGLVHDNQTKLKTTSHLMEVIQHKLSNCVEIDEDDFWLRHFITSHVLQNKPSIVYPAFGHLNFQLGRIALSYIRRGYLFMENHIKIQKIMFRASWTSTKNIILVVYRTNQSNLDFFSIPFMMDQENG